MTGKLLARVHEADREVIDRAVGAARQALTAGWSRTSVRERAALLRRAADLIEERREFVAAESGDTGKPVAQARELYVARAVANFRAFADTVAAAGQESFTTDLPHGRHAFNYVVRKPLGVVAVIVPWNLPLLLTWKVAPAPACGNTVVVKPSEERPPLPHCWPKCSPTRVCRPASTTSCTALARAPRVSFLTKRPRSSTGSPSRVPRPPDLT